MLCAKEPRFFFASFLRRVKYPADMNYLPFFILLLSTFFVCERFYPDCACILSHLWRSGYSVADVILMRNADN